LHEFGGHQPAAGLAVQCRAAKHVELARTRAEPAAVVETACHLIDKAGEQGHVYGLVFCRRLIEAPLQFLALQQQLPLHLAPFTPAPWREEVLVPGTGQRRAAERLALLLEVIPEQDPGKEVRLRMLVATMRLVGRLLAVERPLARVLAGQPADNDQQLTQAAE